MEKPVFEAKKRLEFDAWACAIGEENSTALQNSEARRIIGKLVIRGRGLVEIVRNEIRYCSGHSLEDRFN